MPQFTLHGSAIFVCSLTYLHPNVVLAGNKGTFSTFASLRLAAAGLEIGNINLQITFSTHFGSYGCLVYKIRTFSMNKTH